MHRANYARERRPAALLRRSTGQHRGPIRVMISQLPGSVRPEDPAMSAMSRFTRSRLGPCLSGAAALLVVFASTSAAAREAKLAAGSASCQEAHQHDPVAASPVDAAPAAVGGHAEASPKQGLNSDAVTGGRLQTPRWHSFLPGMFR